MGRKEDKADKNQQEIINLLNQVLNLEYSMIIHYPRIASTIQDEEIKNLVLKLGSDSMGHADIVANAVIKLGGKPVWSFESLAERFDHLDVFQTQLEREKFAKQSYEKCASMVMDNSLYARFNELAKQEAEHVHIVEKVLSKLS
jgi:bacterioferritin